MVNVMEVGWENKIEANEDVIFTLLFVSEIVNVFVKFFNTNVFYFMNR